MKEIFSYHKLKNLLSGNGYNLSSDFHNKEYLFIEKEEAHGYIQPNLSLVEGNLPNKESSQVILISATGATGKTALALMLSAQTNVPIFDLAKYPPVAARAVTGLLFDEFDPEEGELFRKGLQSGNKTLIIDALDEGRVKVNENAFNAFLDDIIKISKKSSGTPFILLGRNQVLEHSYLYLVENAIEVSLLKIEPFTKEQAKEFIDLRAGSEKYQREYRQIRDFIIESLKSFFDSTSSMANYQETEYEKFIGYAPVLSAISTLLSNERNYNKLYNDLKEQELEGINLITTIVEYILNREKHQKVHNIILPEIEQKLNNQQKSNFENSAYNFIEQSSRLLQKELGVRLTTYQTFEEKHINEEYNEKINVWLDEHPFKLDGKFQNIVFESYSLAQVMANSNQIDLAIKYLNSKFKGSYLLFLFFEKVAKERNIKAEYLNFIFNSLKEIEGTNIRTEMIIELTEGEEEMLEGEVEYVMDFSGNSITYTFDLRLGADEQIEIGGNLGSIKIMHPGVVLLKGDFVEFKAPSYIECRKLVLNTNEVVFGDSINKEINENIVFDCQEFGIEYGDRSTPSIIRYIPDKNICIIAGNDLPYPFFDYSGEIENSLKLNPELEPKYRILRRIILSFRSHSKGMLARYKAKIEHRRILKSEVGENILKALIDTGVLYEEGLMYCIDTQKLDEHLKINYHDLQRKKVTPRILYFLQDKIA